MNLTAIKALPTKKKIILLAGIAVVLLLAAVVVWRVFLVKPATQVLDTGTVEKGSIRGVLVETGIIKSQVGAVVKIGAQTTGRIQKMNVKVGDRVKAGELIALVDDREIREQIGQQQAALLSARNTLTQVEQTYPERIREARANHDYAKVNVERERELLKHEYTTKDSVDKAESQFTAAEAVLKRLQDEYRTQLTISKSSVEEIQARLRQQEVRMTYTKIVCPHRRHRLRRDGPGGRNDRGGAPGGKPGDRARSHEARDVDLRRRDGHREGRCRSGRGISTSTPTRQRLSRGRSRRSTPSPSSRKTSSTTSPR